VSSIERLVGALNLDGHGRLALFADLDLLVVALDGCTKSYRSAFNGFDCEEGDGDLHSSKLEDFLDTGDGVLLDAGNRRRHF
jgi:hypothetical protein